MVARQADPVDVKSHVKERGTTHFACEAIELSLVNEDARDVFLNDVDGEPFGGLPARAEVAPRAIVLRA
jgi:hypothetical protein